MQNPSSITLIQKLYRLNQEFLSRMNGSSEYEGLQGLDTDPVGEILLESAEKCREMIAQAKAENIEDVRIKLELIWAYESYEECKKDPANSDWPELCKTALDGLNMLSKAA